MKKWLLVLLCVLLLLLCGAALAEISDDGSYYPTCTPRISCSPGSCTSPITTTAYCRECGRFLWVEYDESGTGHFLNTFLGKSATCTEPSVCMGPADADGNQICSSCGQRIETKSTLPVADCHSLNLLFRLDDAQDSLSKNLEKLSSGYRINRAGDDAAGLAISEKMRSQVTGLDQTQRNAQDGVSLIQTAEGALTEVHNILNRMTHSLATQANDAHANQNDQSLLGHANQLPQGVLQLLQ